jgi:hypothetical protein
MALSPEQAFAKARPGQSVIGWNLDREQRRELLGRFPPRFEQAVADHVTLKARVAGNSALPRPVSAAIVGHADDGNGVEAMVVAIDGGIDRPGGGTYHITWSLGPGRRARESNDVLASGQWRAMEPVPVALEPAFIR